MSSNEINKIVSGKLNSLMGEGDKPRAEGLPKPLPAQGKSLQKKVQRDHGYVQKPGQRVRDAQLDDSLEGLGEGRGEEAVLATVQAKNVRKMSEEEVGRLVGDTVLAIGRVWDQHSIVWTTAGWVRMRVALRDIIEDVLEQHARGVEGKGIVELELSATNAGGAGAQRGKEAE